MKFNRNEVEYILTLIVQCQVFAPGIYNSELEEVVGNYLRQDETIFSKDEIEKIWNIIIAMNLVGNSCLNIEIDKKIEEAFDNR